MTVAKTLAYHGSELITTVKSFVVKASGKLRKHTYVIVVKIWRQDTRYNGTQHNDNQSNTPVSKTQYHNSK